MVIQSKGSLWLGPVFYPGLLGEISPNHKNHTPGRPWSSSTDTNFLIELCLFPIPHPNQVNPPEAWNLDKALVGTLPPWRKWLFEVKCSEFRGRKFGEMLQEVWENCDSKFVVVWSWCRQRRDVGIGFQRSVAAHEKTGCKFLDIIDSEDILYIIRLINENADSSYSL